MYGTVLPKGDYRGYNFKGVNCSMARFTFDSLLPEDIKLLQTINSSFDGDYEDDYVMGEEGFILTKNVIENMHRYDLSGIKIDLRANPSTALQVGLCALAFSKLKFVKELKQSYHPSCKKTQS